jgi:hypothetical protein
MIIRLRRNLIESRKSAAADFFFYFAIGKSSFGILAALAVFLRKTAVFSRRDRVDICRRQILIRAQRDYHSKKLSNNPTIFPDNLDLLTKKVYNIGWK